jgi:hypothetical protein
LHLVRRDTCLLPLSPPTLHYAENSGCLPPSEAVLHR